MKKQYTIKTKRVYAKPQRNDGFRVLVDRLWPRGVSKETAKVDFWLKDIAPSDKLRKWFGHDPKRWAGFQRKYRKELTRNKESVALLKNFIKEKKRITLLFSASDEKHNNAIALKKSVNL